MTNAPDRPANPWANYGNKPHRMGATTPAATGEISGNVYSIRYEGKRGDAHPSFWVTFSNNPGGFIYFDRTDPVICKAMETILQGKPISNPGRYKLNWRMTWYKDDKQHPRAQKIVEISTGEVLAEADAQPALIETTVDEKTGQLTTEKSTSPFGRLGLPAETIEKARIKGEELRAEREKKDAEMAKTDDTANAALQNTLATAEAEQTASADITPEPDKAKTLSELDATFGPKAKVPALPTDGHWSEHGGVALFWATVFNQNEVDRSEEPEARRVIIAALGSKPNEWPDYDDSLKQAEDAIYAMRINRVEAAKPAATKEPSKTGANDSASSVEPPIANEPIVAPKKADSVEPSKPTEIVIEKLSPDEPRPIEMVTTIDSSTGEIIVFDPNRAINLTKARSALVNRLVQDKVLVKGVDYGEVPGTDKATLLKPGAEKLLSAFQLYDKFTDVAIERNWKDGFFFYEYECTLYDRETGKAIGSGIGSCNSMEKKYRFRWVTKDRVPKTLKVDDLPSKGGKIGEFKFAIDKAETSGKYGKPEAYWKQFKDAIAAGSHVTTQRATSRGNSDYIEIDTTMYGIPNEDIFDLVNTISKMAQKRALVAAALNATGASAVFTQDQEDFTDFGLIEAAIA